MGTSMKCEKRSLALLSSKRTKAYTRSKADEAFALPTFSDHVIPFIRETKGEEAYASSPNDANPVPAVARSWVTEVCDAENDVHIVKHRRYDVDRDGRDVIMDGHDVRSDGCDVDMNVRHSAGREVEMNGHNEDMNGQDAKRDGHDMKHERHDVTMNWHYVKRDGCEVDMHGHDVTFGGHDVTHDGRGVDMNRRNMEYTRHYHVKPTHMVVNGHDMEHIDYDMQHDGHDIRCGVAPDDKHDMQQLKQTMLKHESTFKEQLCELHRLYQVQRSLMAEVDRQGGSSSSHPRLDPPSSNGSQFSNLFRERNLFNAESKFNIEEKSSFFSKNLDLNKAFEDVENIERLPLTTNNTPKWRTLFDLEQPANEYIDDTEEDKCQLFSLTHPRKKSENKDLWMFPSGKNDNMIKDIRNMSKEVSSQGSPFTSSQVLSPSRGLYFGQQTVEEKPNGSQISAYESGHNSRGTSNLPHWLLQASPEVKNHPPSLVSSSQQQNSAFFPRTLEDVHHQPRDIHLHFGERTYKAVESENIPHNMLTLGKSLQEQHFSREPLNTSLGFVAPQRASNVIVKQRELETESKMLPWLHNFSSTQQVSNKPSNAVQQLQCITSLNQESIVQTNRAHQANHQPQQANNLLQQATSLSTINKHSTKGLDISWPELFAKRSTMPPMKLPSSSSSNDVIGAKLGLAPTMKSSLQRSENVGSSALEVSWTEILSNKRVIPPKNLLSSSLADDTSVAKIGVAPIGKSGLQTSENAGLPREGEKCMRAKPTKASFDLNVTLNDHPNGNAMETSTGWLAKLGIKASYQEQPKTVLSSSSMKGTSFLDCSGKDLSKDMVENTECVYIGSDVGGQCEGGKSSDGSGLTSLESQEAVNLIKVIEDSNASSGDQSSDSNIIQHHNDSTRMIHEEACDMARTKRQMHGSSVSFAFSLDLNEECVVVDEDHHFGSIHQVPGQLEVDTEAAHVLLWLGSDLLSMVTEDAGFLKKDDGRTLRWLADFIPSEESDEMSSMDVDGFRHSEVSLFDGSEQERGLDSFELSVLNMKPMDPEDVELTTRPIESSGTDPVEESPPPPVNNPRRRSSRRGKVNKDFKREVLPSMSCLSRHEVTEDLQIIEGLIKSSREMTGACDPSLKEEGPIFTTPNVGSIKGNLVKSKGGSRSSRGMKVNPKSLLRVCSWGESTRRKRMSRQRSQWSCLPPSVL